MCYNKNTNKTIILQGDVKVKKKIQITSIILVVIAIVAFVTVKISQAEQKTENLDNEIEETLQEDGEETEDLEVDEEDLETDYNEEFEDFTVEIYEESVIEYKTKRLESADEDKKYVVLEMTMPVIEGETNYELYQAITSYYKSVEEKAESFVLENEEIAKEKSEEQGDAFIAYNKTIEGVTTYEDAKLISIRRSEESYTGGAQVGHEIRSEVFRKEDGAMMLLTDIVSDYDYEEGLTEYIKKNITEESGVFYDNVEELIDEMFFGWNYYLASEGIVIYYQVYDLAPGVEGYKEFLVPYNEVKLEEEYKYLGEINE